MPKSAQRIAQNRTHDAKRRDEQAWRKWYDEARWKARSDRQLRTEPLCRICKWHKRTRSATQADHCVPHRGNRRAFVRGELQSLCTPCHSNVKQRAELLGFYLVVSSSGWTYRLPLEGGFPVRPAGAFNDDALLSSLAMPDELEGGRPKTPTVSKPRPAATPNAELVSKKRAGGPRG